MWTVVPLCYTFPANDARNTAWVEPNAARFPFTSALLRRVPGLRTALFSRLGPRTSLASHQGWAQLSNHVLRVHLALSVPAGGGAPPPCGIVCADEIRFHEQGKALVFDDSQLHSAFNLHASEARVVLIIDLARPAACAPGKAEKGGTAELEAFIKEFH